MNKKVQKLSAIQIKKEKQEKKIPVTITHILLRSL